MSATRYPVIIVGAGMAGFAAARELKARGVGPVLMLAADDGQFYAKPLLSHSLSRRAPAAKMLTNRETCESQYGVRIVPHTTVSGFDPKLQRLTTAAGASFEYDHLVLATGALPSTPWAGPRIFSVNNARDMQAMDLALERANHVLVAGAGFVGLEMANDWHRSGKTVTVASAAAPLSPLLPAQASVWVQARLEAVGISFARGALTLFNQPNHVIATVSEVALPAAFDLVLSAVGLRSNTELARAGGLVTGVHGLVVDDKFRTSTPNVLALGDVIEQAGRPWRFVAALNHAAKMIASHIAGTDSPAPPVSMPISLKCPDAPLVLVLPDGEAAVSWKQVSSTQDGLELRATRSGEACGYILGGAATKQRAALDAWLGKA
jgi:rubredoxin-NAD+ reductase